MQVTKDVKELLWVWLWKNETDRKQKLSTNRANKLNSNFRHSKKPKKTIYPLYVLLIN